MSNESINPPDLSERKEFKKTKRTLSDKAAGAVLKGIITAAAVAQYGMRDGLKSVQSGEIVAGLIDGAIIAPKLAYVNMETGQMMYEEAHSAGMIAFDATRPQEFPKSDIGYNLALVSKGVLWSFMPEEIKKNAEETKTPTGYVEMYNMKHLMTLDKHPLDKLLGEKVLRAVTMAEAYDYAGLDEFIPGLEARRLADDRVYQVTPKGNTLMQLLEDGGDRAPKREYKYKEALIPGLLTQN